ncbi:acyltransferase, partial [Flavobacteriaceae bacterium]|nr:acyltransferase [Flavobacteriaceae bacterium]
IGTGAFIGKGVSIGNNCLIAANSVVTNDVEDYSIVGGTPARKIGDVIVKENQKIELIFDNDSKTKQ